MNNILQILKIYFNLLLRIASVIFSTSLRFRGTDLHFRRPSFLFWKVLIWIHSMRYLNLSVSLIFQILFSKVSFLNHIFYSFTMLPVQQSCINFQAFIELVLYLFLTTPDHQRNLGILNPKTFKLFWCWIMFVLWVHTYLSILTNSPPAWRAPKFFARFFRKLQKTFCASSTRF